MCPKKDVNTLQFAEGKAAQFIQSSCCFGLGRSSFNTHITKQTNKKLMPCFCGNISQNN